MIFKQMSYAIFTLTMDGTMILNLHLTSELEYSLGFHNFVPENWEVRLNQGLVFLPDREPNSMPRPKMSLDQF